MKTILSSKLLIFKPITMKKVILLIIILFQYVWGYSQQLQDSYAFYEGSGYFFHLGGANYLFPSQDTDDGAAQVNIGFDFDYKGNTYNTCTVSVNGAISFTESIVHYNNELYSNAAGKKNIIAPLWDDMYQRTVDQGAVLYKTEGTAPNRKFYVEWKNISWRTLGNTVSFILVLYETTNNIEFRYGPNNSTQTNRSASIGINAENNFMSVTPGNPATVSHTTANDGITTNDYPGNNTFYYFKHWTYISDTNFEDYLENHDINGNTQTGYGKIGNGIDNDHYVSSVRAQNTIRISTTSVYNISSLYGIGDFTNLEQLFIGFNNVSNLNISKNKKLLKLSCRYNNLSSLDLSHNPLLTLLNINHNNFSSIDLSNNPLLTTLEIQENNFSSIDLSNNPLLTRLEIQNNNFSSIDLSNNTSLEYLYISNNQIGGFFDTSIFPSLKYLECDNNQITSLDLDNNPAIEVMRANDNQLTSLSIQNGHNGLLAGQQNVPNVGWVSRFRADNNNYLYCIYVDDEAAANAGTGDYQDWDIGPGSHFVETNAQCQNFTATTYVPDDNFENYLETHKSNGYSVSLGDPESMGNGIAGDNQVFTTRIENVTQLHIVSKNISDLTGIEDFASLDFLLCNHNQLTSLDVSSNTLLTELICYNNQLTNLNVSNTALEELYCYNNQLTNLDVSSNSALKKLHCYNNQLTSLNLDNNTQINILQCYSNQLTELHIQNGANGLLSGTYQSDGVNYSRMKATDNPNLTCIYVDNATDATAGTGDYQNWYVDATSHFVETQAECDNYTSTTYVPDDNFEHYLETHDANGNTVNVGDITSMGNGIDNDDYVLTYRIENVTSLDINSLNISNLTGIEDFTALSSLKCYDNSLSSLDVTNLSNLNTLWCNGNQLSSLDLSQNPSLYTLLCYSNNLTTLDVSANLSLQVLRCEYNQLTNMTLSNSPTQLRCQNNQLTDLDVSALTQLSLLYCSNNQLESLNVQNGNNSNFINFDARNNPNLTCIQVDNAAWSTANWTNIDSGASFGENCLFYDLTTSVTGQGSINLIPIGGNYQASTQVTLTATPSQGWQFDHWSGDLSGSTNPINIIMDADKSVTAVFTQIQHSLTVNTTGQGSVALNPTGGTYNEGTQVSLTATPDSGWQFDHWEGDLTGNTNPAQITMDADKSVTATFVQQALTYVPDDNFEAYLEANGMGNGIANDNYVSTENIENVVSLNVHNQNINDLTGIEDFTALEILRCYSNNLNSLDVSHNTSLTNLACGYNNISSLDISQNTALEHLSCYSNNLSTLDLTQNLLLSDLNCGYNNLNSLDISQNTLLTNVKCYFNNLTSLNLGQNNSLITLKCYNNAISSLNLTQLTALQTLNCSQNNLSALDISNNPSLIKLECQNNQITSLDLDNNPQVSIFWCYSNQLTDLHIQNGANALLSGTFILTGSNISESRMQATNNPTLTCIYVDDATAATAGTGDYQDWEVDATSHFVETQAECDNYTSTTYVPDDNFEHYLETHNASGNTVNVGDVTSMGNGIDNDNYVYTSCIENVTYLNVNNQNISDLTGIEDFAALTTLYCSDNTLTGININQNTALETLYCPYNNLTSLDVSTLSSLTSLVCNNNDLTSLNVKNGNNTNFTVFEARYNSNLTCIQVDDEAWSTSNWSGNIDSGASFSEDCSIVYYNLTTSVTGQGTISPASGTYEDGTQITLTATPAAGWHFAYWLGDLGGLTNPQQLTMDSDKSVTAVFVQLQYELTVDTNGQGSVDLDPDGGTYYSGTQVTLTATPSTGWLFDHWEGDLTGNTNPQQLTMDSDKSVTAVFTRIQHTLTINTTGQGSVTTIPSLATYDEGSQVVLTATPDSGWQFDHWEGDLTGNTNPAVIFMFTDKIITAVFTQIQHNLTVNTQGQGSVALNPAGGTYNEGTQVTLTATPAQGWQFDHWSGDLSGSTNPATITMDADKTVTAVFTQIQHSLTVNTQGQGSVALNPAGGTYNEGTQVTLTATPSQGWQFDHWTGDLSGSTNPATITMDADKTVTAVFTQIQHNLTVNTQGQGSVALNPAGGTYNEGTHVTLTATPSQGWQFDHWTGDLSGSTNPATITMDADKTVTAVFTQIQHNLTVNTQGQGSVALNPAGGTYNEGTQVTLTVTPSQGWQFDHWSGDLSGSTNPATITMDADKTVTAVFTQIQHNLTVNTQGQGSVALNPAGGTYNEGTQVTLTATPSQGWQFDHWSGDLSGSTNPATITMDADKSVTAVFTQIQHSLTVNTQGQGSVALNPAGGTYNEGTQVTLTATPSQGWQFDHWSGDLSGSTNPATITMDADKTVTAVFTQIQYNLTVNTQGQGSVALNPAGGTYNEGTQVTLTATPAQGWQFDHWSGDLSGSTNPANITMDADKTVTAVFIQIQYHIYTSFTGQGTIDLSPAGGIYNYGTQVTLTAIPSQGWEFTGWSADVSGTANPIVVTVHSDWHIGAIFTQLPQTYVPDDNFEHYLETHDAGGNFVAVGSPNSMGNGTDNDDYVTTANISGVINLNLHNKQIADLTGIEDFANIQHLYCDANNLTSIDVSQNMALTILDCGYNDLASLDVSNNTALETLSCSMNRITSLDLSMLPSFVSLDCSSNNLSDLNVQNGNNTNFTRFNATGNPDLTCIFVDDATWSTANWTSIDNTSHFVETQAQCDTYSSVEDMIKDELEVYPNPVGNYLTVHYNYNDEMTVRVYNMVGQEVVKSVKGRNQIKVNLTQLPAAGYIFKIEINSINVYYNIIKE